MALINSIEMRLQELMATHERLVEALQLKKDRITFAPESKVHGFAMTIKLLRQSGVHEIRLIDGQEGNVPRKVILFNFTETGNPIDLRNNFQNEASAHLKARIDAYVRENPKANLPDIVFKCCRSRWEENETISLKEVASIVNNLIDETNGHMRLATVYAYNQATLFVRAQRL
ncbi:hypothetical protein PHMEG_00013404 [Phytophthora megakarya]|uniref:Uncharacterized protein n=1 Tax=Phytophthora megakarya TaxID=4795 RepID=A0A225W6C4_9STRA|nr:hypothetical protein PHMEG_00013404 [Phytophthora megakarya]